MRQLASDGKVLTEQQDVYANDTRIPLICPNTTSETRIFGPDGVTKKVLKTTRVINMYGEVQRETDHGNVDVSGDETTTWNTFYPNTANHVTACAAQSITRTGIADTTALVLARTQNFYGGATTLNTPPVNCNITQQRRYWSASGFAVTTYIFDHLGNLIEQTDPVGNKTLTTYDGVFGLYPIKVEHVGTGLQTETAWDYVCGLPVKQTGFNGDQAQTPATAEVTETSYDGLCRLSAQRSPGGLLTEKSYVNWGDPASQYELTEVSPNANRALPRKSYSLPRRPWPHMAYRQPCFRRRLGLCQHDIYTTR